MAVESAGKRFAPRVFEYRLTNSHTSRAYLLTAWRSKCLMNIGAKHSLCLISMLSNMQPSESMPTKNSLAGLKSRRTCPESMESTIWNYGRFPPRGVNRQWPMRSGVVTARRHVAAAAGPVGMEEFAPRLVNALIGVRAEVIALCLQQVGRQHRGAVLIVECQRRAEGGHGDAALHRGGDDRAPAFLATLDLAAEIVVEQQVHQFGIVVERLLDLAEEAAANDAAAPPHEGNTAVVEVPLVFGGGGAHQHVTLRIADDLR